MDFRHESELRPAVVAAVERHRARIDAAVPDAEVEHIGSTAVPGALTKGDVDLLVRVPVADFQDAVVALRGRYAIHQPENWTTVFASFKDAGEDDPPVGVQLVVAGGTDDELFRAWRDRLSEDPKLLERYNAFKLGHAAADPAAYVDAKAEFIEGVIGDGMGSEGDPANPFA